MVKVRAGEIALLLIVSAVMAVAACGFRGMVAWLEGES